MEMTELDKEIGVEHEFSPAQVMQMPKPAMASLIMTLETGLQMIMKVGSEAGWDGAEAMTSALLTTMREIIGQEIIQNTKNTMVDIGSKKLN